MDTWHGLLWTWGQKTQVFWKCQWLNVLFLHLWQIYWEKLYLKLETPDINIKLLWQSVFSLKLEQVGTKWKKMPGINMLYSLLGSIGSLASRVRERNHRLWFKHFLVTVKDFEPKVITEKEIETWPWSVKQGGRFHLLSTVKPNNLWSSASNTHTADGPPRPFLPHFTSLQTFPPHRRENRYLLFSSSVFSDPRNSLTNLCLNYQ